MTSELQTLATAWWRRGSDTCLGEKLPEASRASGKSIIRLWTVYERKTEEKEKAMPLKKETKKRKKGKLAVFLI